MTNNKSGKTATKYKSIETEMTYNNKIQKYKITKIYKVVKTNT